MATRKAAPAESASASAASSDETRRHNLVARAGVIRDYFRDRAALEAERDAINTQIRELGQKVAKGDLGFKLADVNAAYRLYLLEDEARDKFLDTLKETFDALNMGEQLDFLQALRSTKKPPAEAQPAPAEGTGNGKADHFQEDQVPDQGPAAQANAYEAGRQAAQANRGLDMNPHTHPRALKLKASFEKGWMDVQEERARNLGPPEPPRPPSAA